jgi:hypothetical protein
LGILLAIHLKRFTRRLKRAFRKAYRTLHQMYAWPLETTWAAWLTNHLKRYEEAEARLPQGHRTRTLLTLNTLEQPRQLCSLTHLKR